MTAIFYVTFLYGAAEYALSWAPVRRRNPVPLPFEYTLGSGRHLMIDGQRLGFGWTDFT